MNCNRKVPTVTKGAEHTVNTGVARARQYRHENSGETINKRMLQIKKCLKRFQS